MKSGSSKSEASESEASEARGALAVSVLLIVLGVLLAFYANSIRSDLNVESTVCVVTEDAHTGALASDHGKTALAKLTGAQKRACSASGSSSGLRLAQLTITRKVVSDTLLTTLLGVAAVMVLCGAFFGRVESISFLGAKLGLAARKDKRAVTTLVVSEAKKHPDDVAPEQVEQAKSIAEQAVADIHDFAAGRRAMAPVTIPDDTLAELRRGNPLPEDLLDRLAKEAVEEALK